MVDHRSEESFFNMAVAYLERLNKFLYLCQIAGIRGDIDNWRIYLRAVWREASIKINPAEELEILGDRNNVTPLKELLDDNMTPKEATFLNIDRISNDRELKAKYKSLLLYLLDALEIKIRRILQKKNMLLPSRSDPHFAVMER